MKEKMRKSSSLIVLIVLSIISISECGYLTPQHVQQHIKRLISQKYQLYVINLGQTINNNPLKAYVISGIKKQQSSITQLLHYPATLITSYMHPRQPYSIKLIQTVLDDVLNNYHTDYYFRYMLDNTLLILFPFVNIDGYYLYQKLVDKNASQKEKQSYRKNLNKYGKCPYQWQYGVDINRNFDSSWGSLHTSDIQCGQQYRGPKPFSQKQSRAIKTLYTKFKITLAIDIHSYGNQWIYPYASQSTNQKFQNNQLYPLYQDLFEQFNRLKRPMKGCFESLGYTADGVYIDWALDQGAMSFAVEIGKSFDGDVDIGNEILFQTEQLFHTVLRKNSISYKKYYTKRDNNLVIKSTSLLNFDIEILLPDNTSLGIKTLQSQSTIMYKIDQSIIKQVILKVIDTKIEQQLIINELEMIDSVDLLQEIGSQKNVIVKSNLFRQYDTRLIMLVAFSIGIAICIVTYCRRINPITKSQNLNNLKLKKHIILQQTINDSIQQLDETEHNIQKTNDDKIQINQQDKNIIDRKEDDLDQPPTTDRMLFH